MILGIEYLYYTPPVTKKQVALRKAWEKYYEGMQPFKASEKVRLRIKKGMMPIKAHYTYKTLNQ